MMLILCLVLTGCGEVFRRKFVRKSKAKPKPPVVLYSDEGGETQPVETLYENHFLYWRLWQVEAADLLDRSSSAGSIVSFKRIRSTLESALGELRTVRGYLVEERAAVLDGQIAELERTVASLDGDLSIAEEGRLRRQLEQQRREIERELGPRDAKANGWLKTR